MIRIGYPCMNTSVGCTSAGTLRLAGYSEDKVREKITRNLECLGKILSYNREHNIRVYRVSSNIIPFATHEVMTLNWQKEFKSVFDSLGTVIAESEMRISTHPGQFVLINSPTHKIVENSVRELQYQSEILELLGVDCSHKIQIHVGGIYDDKEASIERFIQNAELLPHTVRSRLIIENDERLYSVEDCARISNATGIPILFDAFHHSINPGTLSMKEAFIAARSTWKEVDGIQQIDYSEQDPLKQVGAHSQSINPASFEAFITEIQTPGSLDIMLEVKDKEQSVANLIASSCSKE